MRVAVLTGGQDRPYAIGLASALAARGVEIDFIGSGDVTGEELRTEPRIRLLNLRGPQNPDVAVANKMIRVSRYYVRLLSYAWSSSASIFHILWNDKFELFDRTLLMMYYRLLGRRIVLTAHNINARKRDGRDSAVNRLTLRIQYALVQRIFVHTTRMKEELIADFSVAPEKVVVIPFGINNTIPSTSLTSEQARAALQLLPKHKVMLFFGRLTPYKGLEFLVEALCELRTRDERYRLIIAGPIKTSSEYWQRVQDRIASLGITDLLVERIGYIPDAQVERYFKAADAVVLPYLNVFQSGVLFLGYSFGLPAIVTDVGSLREEVVEGGTGFVCKPGDALSLANSIETFFSSDLYRHLAHRRDEIREYANQKYSWVTVSQVILETYSELRVCN